jgi:hypothetical protein
MRNDIENPRPDQRYLTIVIAFMLGSGLTGSFLIHALESPTELFRWILLAAWIVAWLSATTYAYRRWYRSRRAQTDADEKPNAKPTAGPAASTPTKTGLD